MRTRSRILLFSVLAVLAVAVVLFAMPNTLAGRGGKGCEKACEAKLAGDLAKCKELPDADARKKCSDAAKKAYQECVKACGHKPDDDSDSDSDSDDDSDSCRDDDSDSGKDDDSDSGSGKDDDSDSDSGKDV